MLVNGMNYSSKGFWKEETEPPPLCPRGLWPAGILSEEREFGVWSGITAWVSNECIPCLYVLWRLIANLPALNRTIGRGGGVAWGKGDYLSDFREECQDGWYNNGIFKWTCIDTFNCTRMVFFSSFHIYIHIQLISIVFMWGYFSCHI